VILLDANLLIYAVNRDLPQHKTAKTWIEKTFSDQDSVGLPWVSVLAFLRLCTNPRVFKAPLKVEDAIAYIDEWVALPSVELVTPGQRHWEIFKNLLAQCGTAGNLVTDAHIAALALERGYAVYSADNDFRRFPGIRHVNPLAQ
jgi:toxin-antitoxin system PIN domain toxin